MTQDRNYVPFDELSRDEKLERYNNAKEHDADGYDMLISYLVKFFSENGIEQMNENQTDYLLSNYLKMASFEISTVLNQLGDNEIEDLEVMLRDPVALEFWINVKTGTIQLPQGRVLNIRPLPDDVIVELRKLA